MSASDKVHELIERFGRNLPAYKQGRYNETQVRVEFIDPLFKALGWDVDNEQGYAEAYKDVVHEDAIKMAGGTKAPDYCFRIGGARKFFVEAKKPSVNIRNDVHPAYQLRRYAWTAKLPLSILTDFEEFAVYDCRIQPDKDGQAPRRRGCMYIGLRRVRRAAGTRSPASSRREAILQRLLRPLRRVDTGRQARHGRGGRRVPGRDRALARAAGAQHRAAQPGAQPARR